jgi:O-antigen/teichoic acid export membrane protein
MSDAVRAWSPLAVLRSAGGLLVESPGEAGRTDVIARRARWRRQATLTTAIGVTARIVAVAVRLTTIPLALRLLGPERYGLWLAVGSLLAWIGVAGPGLSNGLIDAVSDARGRDDWAAMRRHVSTAVFALGGLGLLLLALTPAVSRMPAVASLLGIAARPDLLAETQMLLLVTTALLAASFALEFVGPLTTGLQEGYLFSLAAMASSLAILLGVAAVAINGGTLVTFALVVGIPPIAANFMLASYLFLRRYPQLKPSLRALDSGSLKALMAFGGWMFVTQAGDLAIFQSANLLIASHFGPAAVPRYAVPASVFMNVAALCFIIVQPYWPALKEASVRGDWEFIRSTSARTLTIRLAIMTSAALVVIVAGPPLIRLWAGDAAVPDRWLLVAMSGYNLLITLSGQYVVLLLSFGLARTKALLTLMVGATHVGGFLILSPVLGLMAFPVAGAIGVLADCLFGARRVSAYIREHAR